MCVITPGAMVYELALPFTALAAFLKVIWPRGTPLGSFGQPCRLQRWLGFRSRLNSPRGARLANN